MNQCNNGMETVPPFSPLQTRNGALSPIGLIALACLLPLVVVASPGTAFTDRGVVAAVKSDLHFDQALQPYAFDVSSSQGFVTLTGTVDNLPLRRRAVKIAESVRGVRGVIDQVTVTPEIRPDEDIRKNILLALLNDPATEQYPVAVAVKNGIVTFTGKVGGWAEAQLALHVAEGVRGVKDIRNNLQIDYLDQRTDAEIAADVRASLDWDIWLHGYPIHAEVKDGQVTLSGEVGSALQKFRAEVDAWVRGVQSVQDSDLKVDSAAPDKWQRRKKEPTPSDAAIQQAVTMALRKDPRTSRYAINVMVEHGVVVLEGAVGYLKAKTAAAQGARDIVGVESVDNTLTVRGTMNFPSDADAQKALQAAIQWDPKLDHTQIEAAVVNHVAYLSGSVDYAAQKAEAHDLAARTKGVLFIRNRLTVGPEPSYFFYDQPEYAFETFSPPPLKSDAQLKRDIERAFFWSPFVHRNDITVAVDNGVVALTGTVGTYLGFVEAERDARKSGAVAVINRLKVR